jgi:hypothetical protein
MSRLKVTRRAAVAVIATGVPTLAARAAADDAGLIDLGWQFDQIAAQIDTGIDHGDVTDQTRPAWRGRDGNYERSGHDH